MTSKTKAKTEWQRRPFGKDTPVTDEVTPVRSHVAKSWCTWSLAQFGGRGYFCSLAPLFCLFEQQKVDKRESKSVFSGNC